MTNKNFVKEVRIEVEFSNLSRKAYKKVKAAIQLKPKFFNLFQSAEECNSQPQHNNEMDVLNCV